MAVDQTQGDSTASLLIGQLPAETTEEVARRIFGQYGVITQCQVLPASGPDRTAHITFAEVTQARWLVENLDRNIPIGLGSPISVRFADGRQAAPSPQAQSGGASEAQLGQTGPSQGTMSQANMGQTSMGQGNMCQGMGMGMGMGMGGMYQSGMGHGGMSQGYQLEHGEHPTLSQAALQQAAIGLGGSAMFASAGPPLVGGWSAPGAPTEGSLPTDSVLTGKVKVWLEEKGFGFLAPDIGGPDVFVHARSLTDCQMLVQGASVKFMAQQEPNTGKYRARSCSMGTGETVAVAAPPVAAPPPVGGLATDRTLSGKVKVWLGEKGFGFITPDGGGPDVFVHVRALTDGQALLQGSTVMFEAQQEPSTGKYRARSCMGAVPDGTGGPQGMPQMQQGGPGFSGCGGCGGCGAHGVGSQSVSETICIAGLPADATEEAVLRVFGQYGVVTQCRPLTDVAGPGRAFMLRMGSIEQSKWLVENLHENIPLGLASPILVRYAENRTQPADPMQMHGGGYGRAQNDSFNSRFMPYGSPGPAAFQPGFGSSMASHQTGLPQSSSHRGGNPGMDGMHGMGGQHAQTGQGGMQNMTNQQQDMASAHSQHNPGSEDFRSPNPNSMQGFQQCSQSPRLTGQGTAGGSFLGTPRQSVPGTDAAAHAGQPPLPSESSAPVPPAEAGPPVPPS